MRSITLAIAIVALSLPAAAELPLPDLFELIEPGVVEIATTGLAVTPEAPTTQVRTGGLGSGFLISAEGLIMTAAHVVQTADTVAVRFTGGEIVQAKILASHPNADVALLRALSVPESARPILLGDSDTVRVGDQVAVIGAPLGISRTLTVGYVSAKRSEPDTTVGFDTLELIQTDAAINQGNSGGPLLTMNGQVVGIVSHIISQSGGSQGLGFAITSNLSRHLLLDSPSWWSGIGGAILEEDMASVLNVPQDRAMLVEEVAQGSPASMLGIRAGTVRGLIGGHEIVLGGDIILSVQGISLADSGAPEAIDLAMRNLTPDDVLTVEILRGGERLVLKKVFSLLRTGD